MTWTQGKVTLGPLIANDKDKASWQQMEIDEMEKKERKGTWTSDNR